MCLCMRIRLQITPQNLVQRFIFMSQGQVMPIQNWMKIHLTTFQVISLKGRQANRSKNITLSSDVKKHLYTARSISLCKFMWLLSLEAPTRGVKHEELDKQPNLHHVLTFIRRRNRTFFILWPWTYDLDLWTWLTQGQRYLDQILFMPSAYAN